GELSSVEGTAFDVREGKQIGDQFKLNDAQVELKNGFDHPFVIQADASDTPIALSVPVLNRSIEVSTDCESVVVYTHSVVDPPMEMCRDELHQVAEGTLVNQTIPDSVNHGAFGHEILPIGILFESATTYKLVY